MRTLRAWAAVLVAAGVLASWSSVAVDAAPVAARDGVPLDPTAAVAYQHDALHDGYSVDPGFTAPLDVAWSKALGGSIGYPLVVDGRVFVSVTKPYDGTYLEAFSVATGEMLWGPVRVSESNLTFAAIAYDKGRVFAVDFEGELYALDAATGAVTWHTQLEGQYAFTSPPTAVDGTVYVPGAGSNATLYAVDEVTGDTLWAVPVTAGDNNSPAVDATGVYLAGGCSDAYRYDFDGTLAWDHRGRCGGGGGLTPVLHDGRVYVRDVIYDGYMSSVLDATTGEQIGVYDARPAPAFGATDRLATVWDGALAVSDLTTGKVVWHTASSDFVTAPLVVNGYVVAGQQDGTVEARRLADGTLAWRGQVGGELPIVEGALPVSGLAEGDGALVVPTRTTLTVFRPAPPRITITGGPAPGAVLGPSTTVTFTSNLPDGFVCTLDEIASPCTSPVALPGLADGPHVFTVTHGGPQPAVASTFFTVDAIAPSVTLDPFRHRSTRSRTVVAHWHAVDARSGVALYQLREARGRLGTPLPDWVTDAPTTTISAQLGLGRGKRLCVSVRASDGVGTWSNWSAAQCVRRPRTPMR